MGNITSVRLENFQSHLDTYIEFTEGLNVIVGQSDSGKTAILRGIRWALSNQPRGTDFIRVGADFVRVTVQFAHGVAIIRERTSSKNRYIIQKNEEELVLEGFGVNVPKEVLDAHQMGQLRIDQDVEIALHLAQQLDGPFLLEQTNVTRAKVLGRISGAHYLDMSIRDTSKDLSLLNQRVRQEEEAIEKLTEQLSEYEPLQQLQSRLQIVEQRRAQVMDDRKKLAALQQLKQLKSEIDHEEKQVNRILTLIQHLQQWELNIERMERTYEKYGRNQQIKSDYDEMMKAYAVCELWLKKTADLDAASTNETNIREKANRLHKVKQLNQQYVQLNQEMMVGKHLYEQSAFTKQIDENYIANTTNLYKNYEKISQLYKDLQKVNEDREQIIKRIQYYPDMDGLVKKNEQMQQVQQYYEKLETLRNELRETEERERRGYEYLQSSQEELEKQERAYEQLLLQAGTCPTCGQEICIHEEGDL